MDLSFFWIRGLFVFFLAKRGVKKCPDLRDFSEARV